MFTNYIKNKIGYGDLNPEFSLESSMTIEEVQDDLSNIMLNIGAIGSVDNMTSSELKIKTDERLSSLREEFGLGE